MVNSEKILSELKQVQEMIPDEHDGSYELMREIIASYSTLDTWKECSYLDLNAVYAMAIGTWKLNVEKKKEYVQKSCLPEEEKNRLSSVIDKVWDNACHNKYDNIEKSKPSIGMFGTGFYSFQDKTTKECATAFIRMLVDISLKDQDEAIFDRAEEVLNNSFKGMKAASASVILHCLKPYTFPILNGNMGIGNIYGVLGVSLNHPGDIDSYVTNCRRIKKFRDENLLFKNYRILDQWAGKMDRYQEDEYTPSLKEYDPGITKEKYEALLQNDTQIPKDKLDVLYYLYKRGGAASFSQLAEIFGNDPHHYFENASYVAKVVFKKTKCKLYKPENELTEPYGVILFQGRKSRDDESGSIVWRLRKPLAEAINSLDEAGFFEVFEMKPDTRNGFEHNTILYGPPGTGKTYNSVNYAVAICEGKSFDEVQRESYEAVLERFEELKKTGRIAFTTFHQSYGYEEFIEGIKPVTDEQTGDISYEIVDGIFKEFCEKNGKSIDSREAFENAWNKLVETADEDDNTFKFTRRTGTIVQATYLNDDKFRVEWNGGTHNDLTKTAIFNQWTDVDAVRESFKGGNRWLFDARLAVIDELKKYGLPNYDSKAGQPSVFIIDEINRGNISKIFGELITLIENTKRKGCSEEMSAVLPYSQSDFSVPDNVYILGTMNTADRSIALMDTALRRRFSFIEMMPEPDVLRAIGADQIGANGQTLDVAAMLEIINTRIEYLYDREHTIGHAFFTGLKDDPSIDKLASIFEKSVIPLLQEYFYEDYSKIQLVLGDNAKKGDNKQYQFIRDDKIYPDEVFSEVPEIDLPENKYSIQKDAFRKIESYKLIGKGL